MTIANDSDAVADDLLLEHDSSGHHGSDLTNKSGGDLLAGAVVVYDTSNDNAFTTGAIDYHPGVCGVLAADIDNNASGKVVREGRHKVLVQGNVTRGNWLIASNTSGRAEDSGLKKRPEFGAVGVALTEYSGGGAGDVQADVDIRPYSTVYALMEVGTATPGTAGSTSVTFSHTVPAGTELFIIRYGSNHNADPTGITWNGTGLTKKITKNVSGSCCGIYYLESPASGTHDIVVNIGGGTSVSAIANNYIGKAATAMRTALSGTTPNTGLAVTSAVGDIVIDIVRNSSALTPGADQTSATVGSNTYSSSESGDAGTTTMNWSGTENTPTQCAVAIAGS
jgi:hypothetical protein